MLRINQLLKGFSDKQDSSSIKNASFENPLELLASCHEKMIHFSSALHKLSLALEQEGWTDQLLTTSEQIRHYFNIAGPEHHKDEEQHLFPGIISLDPELKNPEILELLQLINRMIKEHVESDALWESLDKMLAEKSEDFVSLEEQARQFAADMLEHATIENDVIFPYAKAHISASALKKMGAEIAKRRGVSLK